MTHWSPLSVGLTQAACLEVVKQLRAKHTKRPSAVPQRERCEGQGWARWLHELQLAARRTTNRMGCGYGAIVVVTERGNVKTGGDHEGNEFLGHGNDESV